MTRKRELERHLHFAVGPDVLVVLHILLLVQDPRQRRTRGEALVRTLRRRRRLVLRLRWRLLLARKLLVLVLVQLLWPRTRKLLGRGLLL